MTARSLAAVLVAATAAIPGSLLGQALKAEASGLNALFVAADSAVRQLPPERPPTPGIVKYGKWGAAALFVGAMSLAVVEHGNADASFNDLRRYCFSGGSCAIGADGRYTSPQAEALYQDVVAGDRAARALFITGQVAFAGAAALFIVQLMRERGTQNIPYAGLVIEPGRAGTRIGLRVPIRLP